MWCSPLLYLTNSKEGDGKEEDVTIGDDIDFMLEHVKKSVPEKDAAHDATTSAAQENLENIIVPQSPDNVIIPDKGKYSDSNTAVISQSDESLNTLSVHDESAKKDNNADSNVIDVDNLTLTERTPAPSTRKLRSNAGKGVAVSNVPVKTAKEKKIYGLKRQWSKITRPSEPKKKLFKRKTISSSDSEFEEDQHATTSPASSSKKSVMKRRLAVERNLSEDFLQCQ
ncbi:unnamed protein product [Trifolium pratense]|uniref:Uncharacterized protein n=1 Tax=Trifolium pratense TaxID=57577 RepID=A0ACB0LRG4_TRIPR|nr:unnamed protein product [Trifolium pratense]